MTRELIDQLLLERISLASIARATEVSEQWLQTYVNAEGVWRKLPPAHFLEKYAQVPRSVQATPQKRESDDSVQRTMAAVIGRNYFPRFCLIFCRQ
jgi:hypothetical protein